MVTLDDWFKRYIDGQRPIKYVKEKMGVSYTTIWEWRKLPLSKVSFDRLRKLYEIACIKYEPRMDEEATLNDWLLSNTPKDVKSEDICKALGGIGEQTLSAWGDKRIGERTHEQMKQLHKILKVPYTDGDITWRKE